MPKRSPKPDHLTRDTISLPRRSAYGAPEFQPRNVGATSLLIPVSHIASVVIWASQGFARANYSLAKVRCFRWQKSSQIWLRRPRF